MINANYLRVLSIIVQLLIFSCVKEKKSSDLDAGITLSFTAETMKFIKVIGDESSLEDAEKAVMIPEMTASSVTFKLDTVGNFNGEVIFLPNDVGYPDNIIGRTLTPDYLKVSSFTFDNNSVQYYDEQEELIASAPHCDEISSYYQLLAKHIYSQINFTSEEFSWYTAGWKDAGYTVENHGDNLHVVHIPLPDGGLHKMVIDNVLQAVVGSSFFDASGSLLTSNSITIDGIVSNPNHIVHQFSTYTKAPLSEVDIELVYQSTLQNIEVNINL